MYNFYKTLNLLGKGSFGKVYKILLNKDNKVYANKKINVLRQDVENSKNTLTELHILYHNTCPFIIDYYTCFFDNIQLSLIIKYCSYGDLGRLIHKNKKNGDFFEETDIWKIFIQIVYGLHYLHKNNIIHRDIKSANIFINNEYETKIGDFGISKILAQNNFTSTQIGTPLYLSPEMIGRQIYDKKIDIWALGCVLYEMITLTIAFNCINIVDLERKIRTKKIRKIINKNNYSEDLIKFPDKILVVDSKKRLNTDELLENKIIKSKLDLVNYNFDLIDGAEIPPLNTSVTYGINSWKKIVDKYQNKVNCNRCLQDSKESHNKNCILPDINKSIRPKSLKQKKYSFKTEIPKLNNKSSLSKINNKNVLPKINTKHTINSNKKELIDYNKNQKINYYEKQLFNLNKNYIRKNNKILNNKNKSNKNSYFSYYEKNKYYRPMPILSSYVPKYYQNNLLLKIGSKHEKNYNKNFNFKN